MKFQAFDSSYFHGKNFLGDDGFQNMIVYQSTVNMLKLKLDKGTEYFTGWNSKHLFEWKLLPLHGVFMLNIKIFGYKMGIWFNNNP